MEDTVCYKTVAFAEDYSGFNNICEHWVDLWLTNQVWRYIITSNLIGQIKELINFNNSLTLTFVYATGTRYYQNIINSRTIK